MKQRFAKGGLLIVFVLSVALTACKLPKPPPVPGPVQPPAPPGTSLEAAR